ncbi:unnamed protein product [Brassica napus]|uniref:(rape) hypothetical protein n=1 Tax=Brassica napus TaxID=3708 RepID=A0A816RK18_BRANA|nr:unnamed protein product [Brassica napus]
MTCYHESSSSFVERDSQSDEKEVHVEIGPVDENEKSNTPIGAALSADDATVRDLVGDALAQTLRLSWLLWSAIWQ